MKTLILALFALLLGSCMKKDKIVKYASYDEYPTYANESLWPRYSPEATSFTFWSPTAQEVRLNLFENGSSGDAIEQLPLEEVKEGLWKINVRRDLAGTYYTFQAKINNKWLDETPGIYAQAVGVNGQRAMVIDLTTTDPPNWEADQRQAINTPNEAIIYELHVRDLTSHPLSGSSMPGKYLGLVEQRTTTPDGIMTGLDHMQALGITHVHLLPAYDHYSIDETRLDSAQFNWGYDPQNYNVPEGSFATDPYDASVRIREFKQMVQSFHRAGIGLILDVVYNHTGRTENSNFNLESPGYYYRQWDDDSWSDASACGNETASERAMMRKFMLESVVYWAREYHLDGFRFDLMGIHDMATMNAITEALKAVDPNIIVYGEGWTAGNSPLPDSSKALKKNTHLMPNASAFSDDIRDGIKGSVFDDKSTGFVSGASEMEESVKFGVVGSIEHPQVDYEAVNYSDAPWTNHPWEAISYVSCHDNHTLYDKLKVSRPDASTEEIRAMHQLANGIVLTTQGTAFLHAGVEMMRTKDGAHNSYNLPDSINQIDWSWKQENQEVFEYYQSLIALRKAHPAFYMPTGEMVRERLTFKPTAPGLVGFQISGNANGDPWKEILVYYNANTTTQSITLDGKWQLAAWGNEIDPNGIRQVSGKLKVPRLSLLIAFQE